MTERATIVSRSEFLHGSGSLMGVRVGKGGLVPVGVLADTPPPFFDHFKTTFYKEIKGKSSPKGGGTCWGESEKGSAISGLFTHMFTYL